MGRVMAVVERVESEQASIGPSAPTRGSVAAVALPPSGRLATVVLAALEATLDALRAPALIVDELGEVVCSNAAAGKLLGGTPKVIRRSAPVAAGRPGAPSLNWEVTLIGGAGARAWSLMVARAAGEPPPRRDWNLTARQRQILDLVARGMTNRSIAETLGIRLGTVEFHVSSIFDKVGVNNRAALIACVMER